MQGWRLDPLLLFCQLLTAGTALGFAVESLKLRQAVRDIQASSDKVPPLERGICLLTHQALTTFYQGSCCLYSELLFCMRFDLLSGQQLIC